MIPKTTTALRVFIPRLLGALVLGALVAWPAAADEGRSLPAWTKTLTKSQGSQIEHMHHELEDDQAPHKKAEALALKELNEMTVREDVNLEEINGKIGELMAAKQEIMRLRYEHLVLMRRILSDDQKPGYDEGVLKRSAVR